MRSRERAQAIPGVRPGNEAAPVDVDADAARPSVTGRRGASQSGASQSGASQSGGGRRRTRGRLVLAGCLGLTILVVAGWALLGPTVLVVRHVRVTGGGAEVSAADVRGAADIRLGTPLARLNAAAAVRRVERIPAVLSARVSRSYPDTVVISVRPRVPALAVRTASGYDLVDAYGVTVSATTSPPLGIPLLTSPPSVLRGNPAVRVAALVARELPAQLRAAVRSVSATASGATLRLTGGITVVWGGPARAAQKAAELSVLLGTHARYYDVSDPATAVTQR